MGYTHSWRPLTPSANNWNCFLLDCASVLKATKSVVCYESDQPKRAPLIGPDTLMFNGKGYDGCETFIIVRQDGQFDDGHFCKTQQRPYDLAVTACLILAEHYGVLKVTSSGGNFEDWRPGLRVARTCQGVDGRTELFLPRIFQEQIGNMDLAEWNAAVKRLNDAPRVERSSVGPKAKRQIKRIAAELKRRREAPLDTKPIDTTRFSAMFEEGDAKPRKGKR